MQCATRQGLELGKVVHQVAMLVLGLRGHVVELPDVTLPDAQREDLDAALPQGRSHRPGVSAVRVAVGDQEDDLGGVGAGLTQDLLFGWKEINSLSIWFRFPTKIIAKTRKTRRCEIGGSFASLTTGSYLGMKSVTRTRQLYFAEQCCTLVSTTDSNTANLFSLRF